MEQLIPKSKVYIWENTDIPNEDKLIRKIPLGGLYLKPDGSIYKHFDNSNIPGISLLSTYKNNLLQFPKVKKYLELTDNKNIIVDPFYEYSLSLPGSSLEIISNLSGTSRKNNFPTSTVSNNNNRIFNMKLSNNLLKTISNGDYLDIKGLDNIELILKLDKRTAHNLASYLSNYSYELIGLALGGGRESGINFLFNLKRAANR